MQNSNKSFNSLVWLVAPKSKSNGKIIFHIVCHLVSIFNDGFKSILEIMQVMNLTIDPNCFNFCVKSDERRVRFSERSFTEKARRYLTHTCIS